MINTKVRIGITGGEGGIRTLEANLHSPNRLAGGPFRPLKHLSELCGKQYNNTDIIKKYIYGWFVFARIKRSCTFDGAPEGIRSFVSLRSLQSRRLPRLWLSPSFRIP